MKRFVVWILSGALLAGGAGLMMAKAQQPATRALIAGDHPVTAEEVVEKLKSDGWSNIVISSEGKYLQVSGVLNGKESKIAIDSQTGRLRASDDDGDDD